MNNIIGINIKIVLKDIRKMCIANEYKNQLGKAKIKFCLIMCMVILLMGTVVAVPSIKDGNIFEIITIILVFLLCLIIVITIFNFRLIIMSLIAKRTYDKSGLLGNLQRYEFTPEGFVSISHNGNYCISWVDIFVVEELKPCFLIRLSPIKYYIIPKRCFMDKEHLNSFVNLLLTVVDRNKLKLGNYEFGAFSPDHGEIVPTREKHRKEIGDSRTPMLEVAPTNSKKELL